MLCSKIGDNDAWKSQFNFHRIRWNVWSWEGIIFKSSIDNHSDLYRNRNYIQLPSLDYLGIILEKIGEDIFFETNSS